jgi:hypothetical protein
MQVLSPEFIAQFPQIINIHHSFLPAFVQVLNLTTKLMSEALKSLVLQLTMSHLNWMQARLLSKMWHESAIGIVLLTLFVKARI